MLFFFIPLILFFFLLAPKSLMASKKRKHRRDLVAYFEKGQESSCIYGIRWANQYSSGRGGGELARSRFPSPRSNAGGEQRSERAAPSWAYFAVLRFELSLFLSLFAFFLSFLYIKKAYRPSIPLLSFFFCFFCRGPPYKKARIDIKIKRAAPP